MKIVIFLSLASALIVSGCHQTISPEEDKALTHIYITSTNIDGQGSNYQPSIAPSVSGIIRPAPS